MSQTCQYATCILPRSGNSRWCECHRRGCAEDVLIYHKMQDHLIDLLPEKEASWQLFLKDPSLFKTFFQDYEQLAQAQQLAYIAYSRRIDHKRRCVGSTDAGHEKIIHLLGEIITTTPQDNDNGLFALAVIGLLVFVLVLLVKQSK